jgi:putative transposase
MVRRRLLGSLGKRGDDLGDGYPWSSARAHVKKDDGLVEVSPLLEIAGNWRRLLLSAVPEEELRQFRQHQRTGRVLGDDDFQKRLEKNLGRVLRRQKPGPKRTAKR